MAWTDVPDVEAKINAREKNVPWYNPSIDKKLGPSVRELLENYSKIPQAEVEDHVYKIVRFYEDIQKEHTGNQNQQRDEAWNIFPYPCIGSFRFLEL
jgi:hypothetical protein